MRVNSWAEHVRQHTRMAKAETELAERLRAMHSGEQEIVVRHSLPAHRTATPLLLGQFLKPVVTHSGKPEKGGSGAMEGAAGSG
jgi:hypothetical protein